MLVGLAEMVVLPTAPSLFGAPRQPPSVKLYNLLLRAIMPFSSQPYSTQHLHSFQILSLVPRVTPRMICWICFGRKKQLMNRQGSSFPAGTRPMSTAAMYEAGESPILATCHRNPELAGIRTEKVLPWACRTCQLKRKRLVSLTPDIACKLLTCVSLLL